MRKLQFFANLRNFRKFAHFSEKSCADPNFREFPSLRFFPRHDRSYVGNDKEKYFPDRGFRGLETAKICRFPLLNQRQHVWVGRSAFERPLPILRRQAHREAFPRGKSRPGSEPRGTEWCIQEKV